jgi:hypothetical protein
MCGVDRFRGLTVPGAAAINMTVPEVYSVPGGISLMQSPTGLAVVFMSLGAFGLLSPPGERSMACAVEGLAGFAVALLLWFYAIDEVFYVGLVSEDSLHVCQLIPYRAIYYSRGGRARGHCVHSRVHSRVQGFARSCALLSYLPLALAVVSFVLMGLQLVGPRFSRLVSPTSDGWPTSYYHDAKCMYTPDCWFDSDFNAVWGRLRVRSFWVVQVLGSLIGFVIGFELYIVVGYRTDTGQYDMFSAVLSFDILISHD